MLPVREAARACLKQCSQLRLPACQAAWQLGSRTWMHWIRQAWAPSVAARATKGRTHSNLLQACCGRAAQSGKDSALTPCQDCCESCCCLQSQLEQLAQALQPMGRQHETQADRAAIALSD